MQGGWGGVGGIALSIQKEERREERQVMSELQGWRGTPPSYVAVRWRGWAWQSLVLIPTRLRSGIRPRRGVCR